MVGRYGVAGAAFGWALRVIIEVVLLLWIAQRLLSLSATHVLDRGMWTALAALLAAGVAAYVTNLFLRDAIWVDVSLCAVWIAGFALTVWKWVLDAADRSSALAVMGPLRGMFGKSFRSAGAN
jgi:uncharacterized membrane protein (Fun14 family)